jgi:hypothetical protein
MNVEAVLEKKIQYKNIIPYSDTIHTIKSFDPEVHLEVGKNDNELKEELL